MIHSAILDIWCKNCVHMHLNAKMRPVETVSEVGEAG
jgi:hypothetical protein